MVILRITTPAGRLLAGASANAKRLAHASLHLWLFRVTGIHAGGSLFFLEREGTSRIFG